MILLFVYLSMQKILGKVIASIAEHILSSRWKQLQKDLIHECSKLQREHEYFPSLLLQKLLISGEDHRYFRHPGFDLIAICRAIWKRLVWGVQEGASTIEQQTVRILTGRYEKTLVRKIQEILLATLLSQVVSKNEIPALYLNIAYFGWRMNGFKQACIRLKFHKPAISIKDSAALIARLKYPEPSISPPKRTAQIRKRRDYIMKLYEKHHPTDSYKSLELEVLHESI